MSRSLFFCVILFLCASCHKSMSDKMNTHVPTQETGDYNEALATELGADEYGMAQYVMAFLKRGPNRSLNKEEGAALQAAHMKNIKRLGAEGKLAMAGPFLDDGDIRGIYIFNVTTIEEAKALTETDPAIQAGSLIMELHPWYGSAALKRVKKLHNESAKTAF